MPLTGSAHDLLAAYCTAVVHHRRAVRTVNDTAVLLKTTAGAVKHPALQVIRDQATMMRSLAAQLGLSTDPPEPPPQQAGSAQAAAAQLASELRFRGLVQPLDEAAVATCQLLAVAVDSDPTNAALWAQFRMALDDLRALGSTDDDEFDKLVAELAALASSGGGGDPDVRDAALPEPANPRRGDGQAWRRAEAPADAAPAADRRRRR